MQRNGLYANDYATDSLDLLSRYCSEFLVHAADVEGLCQGIDEDLVTSESIRLLSHGSVLESEVELGEWVKVPTTYAGGAKGQSLLVPRGCAVRLTDPLSADISDLDLVDRLSDGSVDLTYGRWGLSLALASCPDQTRPTQFVGHIRWIVGEI